LCDCSVPQIFAECMFELLLSVWLIEWKINVGSTTV